MKRVFLLLSLFTAHCSLLLSEGLVDQLGITVTGTSRQFAYTNKQAGTYYGEVNRQNSGGWQGWFINAQKVLDDYTIEIDGKELDRTSPTTVVFPHQLKRKYPDGAEERFTFLDSVNAIVVDFSPNTTRQTKIAMRLRTVDGFIEETPAPSAIRVWHRETTATEQNNASVITLLPFRDGSKLSFIIGAASSAEQAERLVLNVQQHAQEYIQQRKERMERLLQRSFIKTNDHNLDAALMWAKLSLDALIMNQSQSGIPVKGIFAGLPWFNNYWGRDSFISLPGATFVVGNFRDAREILLSFARFQEKDSNSTNFGRIPNIVTPTSIAYNTADGTPWFVKQMFDYVKYSNDTSLIRELFPVVQRSIEGTLKYHTDSLGFLTHGDAESWMDAVGTNGPWSPRGNRACDVQALWYYQLLIGSFTAEYLTEYRLAGKWKALADSVEKNFNKYFVDRKHNLVYDHLQQDGTPSQELRPNQLFCLDLLDSQDLREAVTKSVTSSLVYEHGVGTLAQTDSNFHPYHHYEPTYVQDAAYHNGIVWTWLNGQAIYALTRNDKQDLSFPITKNMDYQILHRGCVGTLSEILDAQARPGESEPRLSGTFSQAWSLAEFIRGFYQDYLGVYVDATAHLIRLNPKLPKEISQAQFNFRVGESTMRARYECNGDSVRVSMIADTLTKNYSINYFWVYQDGNAAYINTTLTPVETLSIAHSSSAFSVHHNDKEVSSSREGSVWYLKNFSSAKEFADVRLARPVINIDVPALRGPSYPILGLEDVRKKNPAATTLFNKKDPSGDDKGESGKYVYPSSINFKPGILDITHASVTYDSLNAYFSLAFKELVDPGWHPEYGFQLTFIAIAIHRDSPGITSVGENAKYVLSPKYGYDRLVTIGGGIRVSDEKGGVVCEYLPKTGDERDPIGNARRKSIEFSLPLKYLGKPSPQWKMTLLVGAQDDHGGAGIGEFRAVEVKNSEWVGGGRTDPRKSNVYDILVLE